MGRRMYLEDHLNHISEMSCSRKERSPTMSNKKMSEDMIKVGRVEQIIQEQYSSPAKKNSRDSNYKSCVKSSSCVLIQQNNNETLIELSDERKFPMSPQIESNNRKDEVDMEFPQVPLNDHRNNSDSQFKSRSHLTTARHIHNFPPVNYNSVTSMSQSQKS